MRKNAFKLMAVLLAFSVAVIVTQHQQIQQEREALEFIREEKYKEASDAASLALSLKPAYEDKFKNNLMRAWTRAQDKRYFMASKWFGVKTLQNPLDVWITQEIMAEVKPDFVIEAGTFEGGSAILWATMLEHINPDGRVITIDIEDQRVEAAKNHPLAKERVDFVLGSSIAPETISEIAARVRGKSVLVILDSLHTAEHVAAELRGYGPLVQPGSYIIVQDTGGHYRALGYPWKACIEFADASPDWSIDTSRERFQISNNLLGYLRRDQ